MKEERQLASTRPVGFAAGKNGLKEINAIESPPCNSRGPRADLSVVETLVLVWAENSGEPFRRDGHEHVLRRQHGKVEHGPHQVWKHNAVSRWKMLL